MRRNDRDADGRVSRQEFRGPAQIFDRMDANGDGFVTPEEAREFRQRPQPPRQGGPPGPGGRPGSGPEGGGAGAFINRVDTDRDGAISNAEWREFFDRADENGDAVLQPEEWQAALRGARALDSAPAQGAPAPAVSALDPTNAERVNLASPKRLTALVFGSHT